MATRRSSPTTSSSLIELVQLPELQALSDLLVPPPTTLPEVTVEMAGLASYDALIE